jgi:hypothetical protein
MDGRRHVVDQEGDGLVNGERANQMVIVEDQQAGLGQHGQVVEQVGQHDLGKRRRRSVEPGQRGSAKRRRDGLERGDEVAEELVEILVAVVESEPSDRARGTR